MRVALFGGTGTVGTQLLTQALAHGHDVRALVRNPARLPTTTGPVTVVTGDVHDQGAVDGVVDGSDAVLSALGGTNRSVPRVLQAGTANILDAMNRLGVSRLVVVQGFHLPFPGDPNNAGQRLIRPIVRLLNSALSEDSLAMAALVSSSDAEWTIVRCPPIHAGPVTAGYRSGSLKLGPWSRVSAGDVALFALTCMEAGVNAREAPMIAAGARSNGSTKDSSQSAVPGIRNSSGG